MRTFEYDVVLGEHRGMKIAGPRPRIGPSAEKLREVYAAMEAIDRVARENGMQLEAVVLRKHEES